MASTAQWKNVHLTWMLWRIEWTEIATCLKLKIKLLDIIWKISIIRRRRIDGCKSVGWFPYFVSLKFQYEYDIDRGLKISLKRIICTYKTVLYVLKFVSENMSNLEYLELSQYLERNVENQNVTVYFNDLKTLIVHSCQHDLPSKTTFGQLEELGIGDNYWLNSDQWMELVWNQRNLRKITINRGIRDSDILQIANSKTNLVEIIYHCECKYNYDYSVCFCDAKVESIIQVGQPVVQYSKRCEFNCQLIGQ